MAERITNPSEPRLKIDRRELLSAAVGMTAVSIVPGVTTSEAVVVESAKSLSKKSVPVLNISAASARRLQQIEPRNLLRKQCGLRRG